MSGALSVTLAAIADHDPLPSRIDDAAHIRHAIARSLAVHGEVHISLVRRYITRDVAPHLIGAVINGWSKRHGQFTGWRPNGDTKSGNGAKPAPVWIASKETAA